MYHALGLPYQICFGMSAVLETVLAIVPALAIRFESNVQVRYLELKNKMRTKILLNVGYPEVSQEMKVYMNGLVGHIVEIHPNG